MAAHKHFLKENKKIVKVFLVAGTILCREYMAMKYMNGDNLHEHYSTFWTINRQVHTQNNKWHSGRHTGLSNGTKHDGTPLQYSCLENPMDGGAW